MRWFPIVIIALASASGWAQSPAPADQARGAAASSAATAGAMADGEVRRVDKDAQKVTLRHGPLPDLGMPQGMTMVFRVSDPKMLDGIKAGDKVRFRADKVGGQYTVTEMEPVR
jgi:Cu/Ag efflux protein CusF